MSINSCTINEVTIDALCGSRRNAIIATLLARVPQASQNKPHQQHVNPNYQGDFRIFKRDPDRYDDGDEVVENFEQPWIEVSIEMHGQTFTQSLERTPDVIPMINIYALSVNPVDEPTVHITDFTTRQL